MIPALMTLEESHFQVAKISKCARHETSCPLVGDYTTRKESHFQAAKMDKKLLIGIHSFFSKVSHDP
jgi:hypothetical protein